MKKLEHALASILHDLELRLNKANQEQNEKEIEYCEDWVYKVEEMINIYHQ